MKKPEEIKKAEKEFNKFSNPHDLLSYFDDQGFSRYYKIFLPTLGFTRLGLLTSYIDRWRYYDSTGQLQDDGSFFWKREYQLEEMGIGDYVWRNARTDLESVGLIITRREKGVPPKNFYKIGWKSLFTVHQAILLKTKTLKFEELEVLINNNSNLIKSSNKDANKLASNDFGKSFDEHSKESISSILEKWGSFPNTIKHKPSPESMTYRQISYKLNNLLHGRPIKANKDGSANEKLRRYCKSRFFEIPKSVAVRKWTAGEIINVLDKLTTFYEPPQDNPDKCLSLNNVLWSDFGGEWKSRFLRYAHKELIPDKFVALAEDLHSTGLKDPDREHRGSWDDVRESALLLRKKIKENVISLEECQKYIRWIDETMYKWQYTPSVWNAKTFFEKHEKQPFDERMEIWRQRSSSGTSEKTEQKHSEPEYILWNQ